MGEILTELVYVSSASDFLADEELLAILETSRHNNERNGITGMLVHCEGSFLQILEGSERAIDDTYGRIAQDRRHKGLLRLRRRTVTDRAFGNWSMGFARASRADLLSVPGCNDFFADGKCLADVDDGQAKKLLEGFRARVR